MRRWAASSAGCCGARERLEAARPGCHNGRSSGVWAMADSKKMSAGQRAYEAKRAAKAGKKLDTWIEDKRKKQEATAAPPPAPKKPPGLISRLLDRAHKPLKP